MSFLGVECGIVCFVGLCFFVYLRTYKNLIYIYTSNAHIDEATLEG